MNKLGLEVNYKYMYNKLGKDVYIYIYNYK